MTKATVRNTVPLAYLSVTFYKLGSTQQKLMCLKIATFESLINCI